MASVHDVIWLTDAKNNEILYVSPTYEKVWGRTCGSLYDAPTSWLDSVHDDERAGIAAGMESAQRCEVISQQYRIVRPDGAIRLIQSRYYPIKDDTGHVCNTVNIAEDITERHRLEQIYYQAQKMEALSRLAGGVAHDFNNLLTVISGYSDMMLAKVEQTDPQRGPIEHIRRAAERAAALTRQLLAFSRKQVLMPVALDLNTLLREKKEPLGKLLGPGIDMKLALEPNLWKAQMDMAQLDQLITNLVVNAKEAMGQGGKLTIETANVKLDDYLSQSQAENPNGFYVLLTISDTGQGLDEAALARVFEPFTTPHSPGKETGLGLATVYGVVKQSGGRIDLQSKLGVGTTFKIYLPRSKPEAKQTPPPGTGTALRRGTETVLLVEDDFDVRALARMALQSMGYTVLEAKSGCEALLQSQRQKGTIHLLLTDLAMPQMSGRELAGQLTGLRPDIKVLFLSGQPDEAMVHHGMMKPDAAFLQKPFTAAGLARKVREVLERQPSTVDR
jgi:two-component system, cell cycle sensor histidine kinase and response regulator CckA